MFMLYRVGNFIFSSLILFAVGYASSNLILGLLSALCIFNLLESFISAAQNEDLRHYFLAHPRESENRPHQESPSDLYRRSSR